MNKIISYKCVDKDMRAIGGFQYELGVRYTLPAGEEISCGYNGFHASLHPVGVVLQLSSYKVDAKFYVVEQSGEIFVSSAGDVVSSEIILLEEISITKLLALSNSTARVSECCPQYQVVVDDDYGSIVSIGNTPYSTVATVNSMSTAINSSVHSRAVSAGYKSMAICAGGSSTAAVSGKQSIAVAASWNSAAMAAENGAIVCTYYDTVGDVPVGEQPVWHIKSSKVGENGIRPNVYYTLDRVGNFIEA